MMHGGREEALERIIRELVAANETVEGAVGLVAAVLDFEHARLLAEVLRR